VSHHTSLGTFSLSLIIAAGVVMDGARSGKARETLRFVEVKNEADALKEYLVR
jgi:hypothetical protein